MNVIFSSKKHQPTKLLFRVVAFALFLLAIPLSFSSCKQSINYFDYVSELRSNIFLAKTEDFSLRIYAVVKESPYSTDGIPRESFSRMEVHLLTPEGNQTTEITLQIDDNSYGGEMSYDMVKGEYYYAHSVDASTQNSIACRLKYGEETVDLTAVSIITENTIKPQDALQKLQAKKTELFSSLTDKYGFAGEIHLRLLFEDSPYYYIGIIDRNGNCTAFLMNAETGKILAERIS